VGKKTPLTIDRFEEFFRLLPDRADSDRSWTIDLTARKKKRRKKPTQYMGIPTEVHSDVAHEEKKRLYATR
jgi:hypothetical protein